MYDSDQGALTRAELIDLLNEDLTREVRSVAGYASKCKLLEKIDGSDLAVALKDHADSELEHAVTLAGQIDSLGGAPVLPVLSDLCESTDLFRVDLYSDAASIANYRLRVRQAELLGERQLAERIRQILSQEQAHFSRIMSAIGEDMSAQIDFGVTATSIRC